MERHPSAAEVVDELKARFSELATTLLGKPNRALSTRAQLRFGSHGSKAVEIAGDNAGVWFDHEANKGGSTVELIQHIRGLDFFGALDWGRSWLGWLPFPNGRAHFGIPPGGHPDATPHSSPGTGSDEHSDEEGPSEASTDDPSASNEDRDRRKKVEAIVAECQDPTGTAADVYLRSRGITMRPLPASIRYRAKAFGQYGAMVGLVTDDLGQVCATQQIYLDAQGQKAPVKTGKRTNKTGDAWASVASVRLLGLPPRVLCEGVETALSVWQVTGQETWACLGVANFAKAPLPLGAEVILARDGDMPGSPADKQVRKAVQALMLKGHRTRVATPPLGKDFNDLLQKEGAQAIQDCIAAAAIGEGSAEDWRKGLLFAPSGQPRAILANVITALRTAAEWKGVVSYNAFASETICLQAPPWHGNNGIWESRDWAEHDDTLVADWMQHQQILVSPIIAAQAVDVVSKETAFHPVREYLGGIAWDGQRRLRTWLCTYLGASPSEYHLAVGPRWMIGAVARVMRPGCKLDNVLILEGEQGIGKSTALQVLAGTWFTDRLSDLASKDAALELQNVWIVELAELVSLRRGELTTVKAFISRAIDRVRPPYGKRTVSLPRQCVFAGTVNPEAGYLGDATGARRFWPVSCGSIDLDGLRRDRDQLWAEAVMSFSEGKPWWLETSELEALASSEQADRYQSDAWEGPIQNYLENDIVRASSQAGGGIQTSRPRSIPLETVSVGEILEHALNMPPGRWAQSDQNRVARALISLGFVAYRARSGGKNGPRERRYRRPL